MTSLTAPGLYKISGEQYHADPCPLPSLSNSIAKLMLERSARHAWLAHPRLNPAFERHDDRKFDRGTAAHAILLGESDKLEEIPFDDYKKKAAQLARDAALARGRLPALSWQLEAVLEMAAAARVQLDRTEEAAGAFIGGRAEHTVVWRHGPTWCRSRIDWLPDPGGDRVIYDYKTTAASANPERWERQLFDLEFDLQAMFYRRGMLAVTGAPWEFRFIVQECEPPYGLSVAALAPEAAEIADEKVDAALRYWTWCLEHDRWPGYPRETAHIEPPPWRAKRWEYRKLREQIAAETGAALHERMIEWQAPDKPALKQPAGIELA